MTCTRVVVRAGVLALLIAGCVVSDRSHGGTGPDSGTPGTDNETGKDAGPSGAGSDVGPDAGVSGPVGARRFPDTTGSIAILSDQLPPMTAEQQRFVATHFVGTEKQLLGVTRALRALNPGFLVLHYHLAMWQSEPSTSFIIDGQNWSNDYPEVTTHESWFWHNAAGARVPSASDGKLLMNITDSGFAAYWSSSLTTQVAAGEYDGVFLDSASPALLHGECGSADPRLLNEAARTQAFPELGGLTWIAAWDRWIGDLDAALATKGAPLIVNSGPLITTWDTTDYGKAAGIFAEGFADPGISLADWKASCNQMMGLAAAGKIIIQQNYLKGTSDLQRRLYFLGNYLLTKHNRTYLSYFASGPLEWYPEWGLDLGNPVAAPSKVDALAWQGLYRRDFANGAVLVNPGKTTVTVSLAAPMRRVDPQGGGAIPADGSAPGSLAFTQVTTLALDPTSAAILLK